jgi:MFS family permease
LNSQPRTYVLLFIALSVAFSSFLMRLNAYMLNVSLPTIARSFGISSGDASQVITAYLLIITTMLLLFGKLSDRIGLKRVFIAGYAVFAIGSLCCGLSQNFIMLIVARIIQGTGASMLLAVSFAMIAHFLPAERTGWAFGITSTASALGVATGPP